MTVREQRGMLGTVRNAALLLELLADGPPFHHLTDLAERAGMSLPTVHRLLRSLSAAGLVQQDPQSLRYGLGPQLVYLSQRYLDRLPVLNASAPFLVQLRDELKATVMVAVLVRGYVAYVDRVDAEEAGGLFRESSRLRHAFETPAGQLLAAQGGEEAWLDAEAALGRADGIPAPTASSRQAWAKADHLLVAENGEQGAFEVAVPVRGHKRAVASLVATGDAADYDKKTLVRKVAPQLQRAAQAIARVIAHA
jgi:IclR family acetate operon transcriptional repressor